MKFEAPDKQQITVALTPHDLSDLDITYEELDYSNIETRRVIWTILDEAKKQLGSSIDTDGRLLIEVSPLDNGGCLLVFTSTPLTDSHTKRRLIMKKDAQSLIFCPFNEDCLIFAVSLMNKERKNVHSFDTYKKSGEFFILFRPRLFAEGYLSHILSEYGEILHPNSTDLACFLEEGQRLN